jgi:hypothetical protein
MKNCEPQLHVDHRYDQMLHTTEYFVNDMEQRKEGLTANEMVIFCRHETRDETGHHDILRKLVRFSDPYFYPALRIRFEDNKPVWFNISRTLVHAKYPKCCSTPNKLFVKKGCPICKTA